MKIAVYLGSNKGNDPMFQEETAKLGDWIAEQGYTLVYGGACLGLMNVLAEHVLSHGGRVIGVMPKFMIDHARQRNDLSELIITEDMSSRKKKMMELADAYIAMPGGPGTLEEIAEVISSKRLGLIQGPCILMNLNGYYNALKAMLEQMCASEFAQEEELRNIFFPESDDEAFKIIEQQGGSL